MTLNCKDIQQKIKNNELLNTDEMKHIEKCEFCRDSLSKSEFLIQFGLEMLKKDTSEKEFDININQNIMNTIKKNTIKKINPLNLKLIILSIFLLVPFIIFQNTNNSKVMNEEKITHESSNIWNIIFQKGEIDIIDKTEDNFKIITSSSSEYYIKNNFNSDFLFKSNTKAEISKDLILLEEGSMNINIVQPERLDIEINGIRFVIFKANAYFEIKENDILIIIFEGSISSKDIFQNYNFGPMTGFEISVKNKKINKKFKITSYFLDKYYNRF